MDSLQPSFNSPSAFSSSRTEPTFENLLNEELEDDQPAAMMETHMEDNMEDLTNLRVPELRSTRFGRKESVCSTSNGNSINSKEQRENYPAILTTEGKGRESPILSRHETASPTFSSRLPRMKSSTTLRDGKGIKRDKVYSGGIEVDEMGRTIRVDPVPEDRLHVTGSPTSTVNSKKPRLNSSTSTTTSSYLPSNELNSSTSSSNSDRPKQNGSKKKSSVTSTTTAFPIAKPPRPRSGSTSILSTSAPTQSQSLPTRPRAKTANLLQPKAKPIKSFSSSSTRTKNMNSLDRRGDYRNRNDDTEAQPSWSTREPLMLVEDLDLNLDEATAFGLGERSISGTNWDNVILPVVAKAIRAKLLAQANTDDLISAYDKNHNPIATTAARIRTPSPNPPSTTAAPPPPSEETNPIEPMPLSSQPYQFNSLKRSKSQNYSRPLLDLAPLPLTSPPLSPRLHRLNNPPGKNGARTEVWEGKDEISTFDDEKGKRKQKGKKVKELDGHEGGCCSCVIC